MTTKSKAIDPRLDFTRHVLRIYKDIHIFSKREYDQVMIKSKVVTGSITPLVRTSRDYVEDMGSSLIELTTAGCPLRDMGTFTFVEMFCNFD